jgi:hypothetical protein
MLRFLLPAVLATVLVGGCGTAGHQAQPTAADLRSIKRLAVVVTGDTGFRVVAARAEGAGSNPGVHMATIFGGIIGGAIAAGIVGSQADSRDEQEARALAVHLDGFSPHRVFAEAFARTLQESGRPLAVVVLAAPPDAGGPFDAVAEFRIEDWGIRRVVTDDPTRLAGFVTLEARLAKTRDDAPLWREWDTVLGQGRHDVASYRADSDKLRNELRGVAMEAGERMAMRLLYPQETPR